MGIQPSASRTALLLECPRPFDPEGPTAADMPGEAARYGSAFHRVIATCLRPKPGGATKNAKLFEKTALYDKEVDRAATQYDVKAAAAELAGHVKSSVQVLRTWLAREKLTVLEVEKAYGITPFGAAGQWQSREIAPHDENHRYDVNDGEIPATLDLIAEGTVPRGGKRLVVIDHKTGSEGIFALPAKIPQMQTLGLIPAATIEDVEVGIFHADRRGLPVTYAEPYDAADRQRHSLALQGALGMVGKGFLRPGGHCDRCPARTICPAHAANLLSEGAASLVETANTFALEPPDPKALYALETPEGPGGASLELRAGSLYALIKRFEKLGEAGLAEIRRLVAAGSVIETRDGKTLVVEEQTFETLSKKSIVEALGKVEGEKMIEKLRQKGAVRESTRKTLVARK